MEQQITLQQVLNSCEISCTYACQTKNCASCPLFYGKMNLLFNNFETLAGSAMSPQQMPNFDLINKWLQEQEAKKVCQPANAENFETAAVVGENPKKLKYSGNKSFAESSSKQKFPKFKSFKEAADNRNDIKKEGSQYLLYYKGAWVTITAAAKEFDINPDTLRYRIWSSGWSVEDAIETPINKIKSGAAEKKSGKPSSKASEQSDLEKKVVDLYSNTTTKVADIVNACGIDTSTLYKILDSNNVPRRGYNYKYSKKAKSVTIDNPKCDQWKRSMYDKMQQAAQKFRDKHHNDRKARITQSDVQHATIKKMTDIYGFVLEQARKEVFSSTVYTPETRPSVLEIIYNCPSDVTYKGSTMSWSECFDVCLTEVIKDLNKISL